MNRRTFVTLIGLPVLVGLALAACGDDSASQDSDRTDPTTLPPTTTAAPTPTTAAPIVHATGPDDVVFQLEWLGGFVGAEYTFTQLPRFVVTGDGSVYTLGAQIEIYPQPLLPPVLVGHIDEVVLQEMLITAGDADLLRNVTYDTPGNIADAPDTVLTLTVDGTTYVHRAYALGISTPETDADRDALSGYVGYLEEIASRDHGDQPFTADSFAIRSQWADAMPPLDDGIVPDEVTWPAQSAGIALTDATECAIVPASAVGELFASATQITRFVDATQKYVLLVRPVIPGDRGC